MAANKDESYEDYEIDPAAEFLAREQTQLAGLEEDLNSVVQQPSPTPITNGEKSPPNETAKLPLKPEVERVEPEKIRKWREDQQKRLAEKDAAEEKKKEEWRAAAKRELEEWYKHHNELILKTKEANRNAEKQFVADVDEIEPGTEWERIAKLCDFNPKSNRSNRDTSRLRSIILQLKQIPLKKSIT